MRIAAPTLAVGPVLGRVVLRPEWGKAAAGIAAGFWEASVAEGFCDEAVETFLLPEWLPSSTELFPASKLASLGLELAGGERQELVATYGVSEHVDSIHGLVLFLVLHNDGLTFRQGKTRHATVAGEYFVTDDRLPHGVKEVAGRGVYLGWSIPVRRA